MLIRFSLEVLLDDRTNLSELHHFSDMLLIVAKKLDKAREVKLVNMQLSEDNRDMEELCVCGHTYGDHEHGSDVCPTTNDRNLVFRAAPKKPLAIKAELQTLCVCGHILGAHINMSNGPQNTNQCPESPYTRFEAATPTTDGLVETESIAKVGPRVRATAAGCTNCGKPYNTHVGENDYCVPGEAHTFEGEKPVDTSDPNNELCGNCKDRMGRHLGPNNYCLPDEDHYGPTNPKQVFKASGKFWEKGQW